MLLVLVAVGCLRDPKGASSPPAPTPPSPSIATLTLAGGSDDVTWHPDGYLIASDLLGEGSWPAEPRGHALLKIDVDSGFVTTWADGVPMPLGSARAADGTLYVAGYGAIASLWAVDPGGLVREVAGGLSYPTAAAIDDAGAILVTEWSANRISRVVDGRAAPFAQLPGPLGIERGVGGQLVVTSADGWLYHLGADGSTTRWVELPAIAADIAAVAGVTYATSLDAHQVFAIDAEGHVSVLVGTGQPGNVDGALSVASLTAPNGIAASPDGRHLYLQQLDRRVRVITL